MAINNVIGVVDALGFHVRNKFYPREFAFVSKRHSICFEVLPDYDFDLEYENYEEISKQSCLFGVTLDRMLTDSSLKVITTAQIVPLIFNLYDGLKINNESCIAIKCDYFKNFIGEIDVPLLNLTNQRFAGDLCPPLAAFDQFGYNFFCPLHTRVENPNQYRCSLRKARNIFNWIKYQWSFEEVITGLNKTDIRVECD